MNKIKNLWGLSSDRKIFGLVITLFLLISIPATIFVSLKSRDFRSKAEGTSVSTEAESSSLYRTAVSSDTDASGGNFIQFGVSSAPDLNYRVHAFYYTWYGNPNVDGSWKHWEQNGHTPPEDISSNFYPQLGAYSNGDSSILRQHMKWLRQAKIGVIVYSWWGQGSREDVLAKMVLDEASLEGVKLAWHIEPYSGRTAESIGSDIKYLYDKYGNHEAFFRTSRPTKYGQVNDRRGVFYVFDSRAIPASDWRNVLDSLHSEKNYNPIVLGNDSDACYIDGCGLDRESHFDGLYTYDAFFDQNAFASVNNPVKTRFSIFSPSVSPGFDARRATNDTRVRERYNDQNCSNFYTYDCMWFFPTSEKTEWVSITSFNEWHEGTQIEPAVEKVLNNYTYQDYNDFDPLVGNNFYLTKTSEKVDSYTGAVGQIQEYSLNCPALDTSKGLASYSFTLNEAGTYKVWSRINSSGDSSNSYLLQIDDLCGSRVGDQANAASGTWTWVDFKDGDPNSKITVSLEAGAHTVKLVGAENGLKLDRVIFTKDFACTPSGNGDTCDIKKVGDINQDNLIDSADLAILLSTWTSTTDLRADINLDKKVDSGDLAILISSWGR